MNTRNNNNTTTNNNNTTNNNTTVVQDKPPTNSKFAPLLEDDEDEEEEAQHNNNTWASIAKAKPTPTPTKNQNTNTNTTKDNEQIDANYHHYYRYIEDYSRSPNLGEWLSEPSVQQEQQKELAVKEKYRDRLYEILYEYFKNEFHRERTGKVVDRLIESSSEKELEEFMSNRLYLEDCADEIFTALKQFDPPMFGIIHSNKKNHTNEKCSCLICTK